LNILVALLVELWEAASVITLCKGFGDMGMLVVVFEYIEAQKLPFGERFVESRRGDLESEGKSKREHEQYPRNEKRDKIRNLHLKMLRR
jgi:hypothetical protein